MIPVPGRAATDPVEAPKRTTSPVTDQGVLGDFRFKGQSPSLSLSEKTHGIYMDASGKNLMYGNWCTPCLNIQQLNIIENCIS